MDGRTVLYRGSLKSCNYHCSYCPFAKKPLSDKELRKDREQWDIFTRTFKKRSGEMGVGALMIAPYGEALIHPWYWEGRTGAYQRPSVDRSGGSADELQLFGREIIGDFYGSGRNSGKTEAVGNFSSGDDNRFGICKKVRTDGGQRCIT